jgi:hypothetical protein
MRRCIRSLIPAVTVVLTGWDRAHHPLDGELATCVQPTVSFTVAPGGYEIPDK